MTSLCEHTPGSTTEPIPASGPGSAAGGPAVCVDCAALGEDVWAHLRMCLTCGHVACCDSSPHRHASAHARAASHPVMRSFEPGESWRWCYLDERIV